MSNPAILQLYEARFDTIEQRMVDIFYAGYGAMWLPPPGRADQGNLSVGYDVYDRFDLGKPRNETLYGTENYLKSLTGTSHNATVDVYTDLIINHNGYADLSTVDDYGTPGDPSDDVTFAESGGYPGFVITLPGDIDGDFHGALEGGDLNGRLAGLIDIAQEKNHQFIRHPTEVGNPNNLPAGTAGIFGRPPANVPDPNNARFYPDQASGGLALYDPELSTNVTRYDFNNADPLAGDPVSENAMGLLMRNAQWMVQAIGVDGFRIDAAKHVPEWALDYIDQAVFRANPRTNLDGSIQPVFMFSEVLDGNKTLLQTYIREDLPDRYAIDPGNTTVGGNRDALDFPLFYAMRDNLTGNGFANNWHGIRNASQDTQDGLRDGSQGVAFVDSHDNLAGGFPYLRNVAYAYTLLKPGDAIVYFNAKEFGEEREFPNDGKDDALGGYHGDSITTLLDIRNTHGRGDFRERWIDEAFGDDNMDGQQFSNIYIYERSNSMIVAFNSRLDAGYDERGPVQTDFLAGTVLVELTGNAADGDVDPGGNIPEAIRVDGSKNVTIRVPRSGNDVLHRGYVVYGVASPQGTMTLTNVADVLEGTTPSAANNGTARIGDVDVITDDSFTVQLATTPVTLPAPFGEVDPVRDYDADGDNAFLRVDGGLDVNANPGVDVTQPGSVLEGFEDFTDTHSPGYVDDGMGGNIGAGSGLYEQTIDATQLSEGYHFITTRAFRHRDPSEPAVYTDFKRAIYVDRLDPVSEFAGFELFGPDDIDVFIRSVDQTADRIFVFLNLPANLTEQQILNMNPSNSIMTQIDRDLFLRGFFDILAGNQVVTIVTREINDHYSIQRFTGLYQDTSRGLGLGDLNGDNAYSPADMADTGGGFEQVLYSQNSLFRPAADTNGDGLVDNRDLFDLADILMTGGANQATLDAYHTLLLHRGDVNDDGFTNALDVDFLRTQFGATDWLTDLDVSGIVDGDDVDTLIKTIFATTYGDSDLDGDVDLDDYDLLSGNYGNAGGWGQGDFNGDGSVNFEDFVTLALNFGEGEPDETISNVPEPSAGVLLLLVGGVFASRRSMRR